MHETDADAYAAGLREIVRGLRYDRMRSCAFRRERAVMARPKKDIHLDLPALAAARAGGTPWKEMERATGLSRWTLARRLRNFFGAKPVLHHRDDGQRPTAVSINPSVVTIKKS